MPQNWNRLFRITAAASALAAMLLALSHMEQGPWRVVAQDRSVVRQVADRTEKSPSSFLSSDQWRQLDTAVDQGLGFITKSQNENGSFPTQMQAQPGVTALGIMALLARGHQPGKGRYGVQI